MYSDGKKVIISSSDFNFQDFGPFNANPGNQKPHLTSIVYKEFFTPAYIAFS